MASLILSQWTDHSALSLVISFNFLKWGLFWLFLFFGGYLSLVTKNTFLFYLRINIAACGSITRWTAWFLAYIVSRLVLNYFIFYHRLLEVNPAQRRYWATTRWLIRTRRVRFGFRKATLLLRLNFVFLRSFAFHLLSLSDSFVWIRAFANLARTLLR